MRVLKTVVPNVCVAGAVQKTAEAIQKTKRIHMEPAISLSDTV